MAGRMTLAGFLPWHRLQFAAENGNPDTPFTIVIPTAAAIAARIDLVVLPEIAAKVQHAEDQHEDPEDATPGDDFHFFTMLGMRNGFTNSSAETSGYMRAI